MCCLIWSASGNGERDLVLQLPQEGAQLPCDGDNGFVLPFAARLEFHIAFVQAFLHAPGKGFDFLALALLASAQGRVDPGRFAVVLAAFDQHPPRVAVAALGNPW